VPIFFEGQNSRLFQIASHISSTIRLSLIFKEVHDRIGTSMRAAIGRPIPADDIAKLGDRKSMLEALRLITYGLAADLPKDASKPPRGKFRRKPIIVRMKLLKRKATLALAQRLQDAA
jgi:putative hemolysin